MQCQLSVRTVPNTCTHSHELQEELEDNARVFKLHPDKLLARSAETAKLKAVMQGLLSGKYAVQFQSLCIIFFYFLSCGNPQPEAIGHTRTCLQPESGGRHYAQSAALSTGK